MKLLTCGLAKIVAIAVTIISHNAHSAHAGGNKLFSGDYNMAAKTFDEWVHNTMETEHVPTNAGGWLRRAWEAATEAAEEKFTSTNKPSVEIKPDCGNCLLAGQCTYFGFPSDSCGYSARV